ncbi:MAG: hypothetical protein Q7K42_02780, partial [Candidatus Diapherotrites archaeon]|nr:hypothetical protein [Candidatus Diapherotrites archaeon]
MRNRFFFLFGILVFFGLFFSLPVSAACNSNEDCPAGMECDMSMGNWGVCAVTNQDPCQLAICDSYCQTGVYYSNG